MPFATVQAQDRALRVVRSALRTGRVPHAWLFTGPDGVGKGMAARALAESLVCEDASDEACGACVPCSKVASGVHPDVCFVEPEGAGRLVKIDQVRAVTRTFRFAPFEGRHRVVVFPVADRLNAEAANALLKSLEEPPDRTVLVLVTALPHALLDTIRSRCQQVRFAPLPRDLCARILVGRGVAEADGPVAAALAEGSAGRALELAEAGLLELRRATVEAVGSLSLDRPGELFELAAEWTGGSKAADARDALSHRLDLLSSWYRDLLLAGVGGEGFIHADLEDRIRESTLPLGDALRCLDRVQEARLALTRNATARLACERMLVGLASGGM